MKVIISTINKILDFVYPLFKFFLPKSTFRYLACGGSNAILDFILFSVIYNYILKGNSIQINIWTISPHIASLYISLLCTMPTGFLLSKYIVFISRKKNKREILMYSIIVFISLFLNYLLMNFFVEILYLSPILSKISTTSLIILFNYFGQKKLAFQIT